MQARPAFPPRLFLIGAQKCATTYFAECLAADPRIALAQPKEPDFFTRHHDRGLDWYRGCFAHADPAVQVLVDASTSYSVAPGDADQQADRPLAGVPGRILAQAPDARFVYIVRDPVKRVHSAYWHAVAAGSEQRPFRSAVDADPWYLDASRYARQLRGYLAHVPSERVLVMEMRRVIADPGAAVAQVCRHVGLSAPVDLHLPASERNASYRLNALGGLLAVGGGDRDRLRRVAGRARRLMPERLYGLLRRGVTRGLPEMTAADAAYVRQRLGDDPQQFAALTGIDLIAPARVPA